MKKKTIIYIACAVALTLIIAFTIYFVVIANKGKNTESDAKIVITKYDENFKVEKEVEVTNKKQIKEINKICENPSLEQDDTSPYLAIRNDVKLDLGNNKIFMIQLALTEYCYYEDANSNTKLVIKMPNGLLELVNNVLSNAPKSVSKDLSSITINRYEHNSVKPISTKAIENKETKKEILELVSKITKLNPDEYVDLLIIEEIEIVIDDNIYIGLQKSTPKYCYYKNINSGESYLAKTPEGLLNIINGII